MKKFKYSSETPTRFSIGDAEFYLERGGVYELPEENPYIWALIVQGILVEQPAEPAQNIKKVKQLTKKD